MSSQRARAGSVLLPVLQRWAVEAARDLYLQRKGAGPPTLLPRARASERARVLAEQALPHEWVEGLRHVSRRLRAPRGSEPAAPEDTAPFSTLGERVLERSAGYRGVGFDVFNTLLVRAVEGERLKTTVARAYHARLRELLHPKRLPTLAQVRQRRTELEEAIAAEQLARGRDNEVDFEQLVLRWADSWVPTEPHRSRMAAELRAWELELEKRALKPAPGIPALLAALQARGQRLVFVSDMYLSEPQVRELLRHHGLESFFSAGYVSIDHGLRKASGRLFPHVLEREGLRPEEFFFVGDDAHSDGVQPRSLGITTLRVDDAAEHRRRRQVESAQRAAEANPFWSAHALDAVMRHEARAVRHEDEDASYQLGLTLAPGLVAFVLDLVERCERLGIRRVYFLSREGLTLLKVFSLLKRGGLLPRAPEARYLFVSRASTILASMRELSWEEIHRFWQQYPRQSLRVLLTNLGLPADVFLPLAAECGLTDPDRPIPDAHADAPFQRFLTSREVRAAFTVHRDAARAVLAHYLSYRGLMGLKRTALVDVGWKGSMQDNLVRAFEGEPRFPEVHGFYLAYTPHGPPLPPRSFKYGYLADLRRRDFEEADLLRNTPIFEMVTTANHGSTVGYAPHPHAPHLPLPVLVHHDEEKRNVSRFFRQAQRGLFDYTRDFARVAPLLRFSADELKPGILDKLLRYTRYPTRREAEEFLQYSHVESFGVHEVTTFGLKWDASVLRASAR